MKKDFESRFMPNVKFFMPNELQKQWCEIFYDKKETKYQLPFWGTSKDGNSIFYNGTYYADFTKLSCIEVSVYEAIPELIPDGMRYNKELDKLVPDVVSASDEYCSGIEVEFEKVVNYLDQKENISCKNEKSKHYEIWKDFEAIDVLKNCLTKDEFIGFLKGNILKYQLRLGKKDDVSKEIEKIKDYQNELNYILKELNVK